MGVECSKKKHSLFLAVTLRVNRHSGFIIL